MVISDWRGIALSHLLAGCPAVSRVLHFLRVFASPLPVFLWLVSCTRVLHRLLRCDLPLTASPGMCGISWLGTVAELDIFVLVGLALLSMHTVRGLVSLTGLLSRPCSLPLSRFARGIESRFELFHEVFSLCRLSVTRKTASVSWEISV